MPPTTHAGSHSSQQFTQLYNKYWKPIDYYHVQNLKNKNCQIPIRWRSNNTKAVHMKYFLDALDIFAIYNKSFLSTKEKVSSKPLYLF